MFKAHMVTVTNIFLIIRLSLLCLSNNIKMLHRNTKTSFYLYCKISCSVHVLMNIIHTTFDHKYFILIIFCVNAEKPYYQSRYFCGMKHGSWLRKSPVFGRLVSLRVQLWILKKQIDWAVLNMIRVNVRFDWMTGDCCVLPELCALLSTITLLSTIIYYSFSFFCYHAPMVNCPIVSNMRLMQSPHASHLTFPLSSSSATNVITSPSE